jgi:predicted small secreted protein
MKRYLIATLLLACLALTQGNLMAGLVGLDQPAAASMTDVADPNDGLNE